MMDAIASLLAAYNRAGNWLLPLVRSQPELARLPMRWTANSVHVAIGGGDVLAFFGGKAPETAPQKLIKRLWRLWPWMTDFAAVDYSFSFTILYGQNSGSYAIARSTFFNASSIFNVGQAYISYLGNRYDVDRGFVKFDTSSIGTGSTVSQVNLKLTCLSDSSDTADFDIQIVKYLVTAFDDTNFDGLLGATVDQTLRNSAGISPNTQYTSPNLDTAWVNRTGTTGYGLVSSLDIAATPPTGNEYVNFANAVHATPGYRPVLAVTYGAAVTGPHRGSQNLLGVGL